MERQTLPESVPTMRPQNLSTARKVNFSEKKVFAGSGGGYDELRKGNCESVAIQPFTNFKGDQALCQMVFSGGGHSLPHGKSQINIFQIISF